MSRKRSIINSTTSTNTKFVDLWRSMVHSRGNGSNDPCCRYFYGRRPSTPLLLAAQESLPREGSAILGNMPSRTVSYRTLADAMPPAAGCQRASSSGGQSGYSELKPPKLWRRGGLFVRALLGEEIRVVATIVSCCWPLELNNSESVVILCGLDLGNCDNSSVEAEFNTMASTVLLACLALLLVGRRGVGGTLNVET